MPAPLKRARTNRVPLALVGVGIILLALAFALRAKSPAEPPQSRQMGRLTLWWNGIPQSVRKASQSTGDASNIALRDYVGPATCKECHPKNHEGWSKHPHRWMNALANEETVKGDFSGAARVQFLGGKAEFYREGEEFRMRLQRGDVRKVFKITQTIGSRFFQDYIGRLIEGPAAKDHPLRHADHVLPFVYWLERREWVPISHVTDEKPDGERHDPFPASRLLDDPRFPRYDTGCNLCHTTFPLGDSLIRKAEMLGKSVPGRFHFSMSGYLADAHPELMAAAPDGPGDQITKRRLAISGFSATEHAATLGVSCEACHLGGREHAAQPKVKPTFFPTSPHLLVKGDQPLETGRSTRNLNWICGRCHAGYRPQFAAGMSTWNSVESTDAHLGACYSKLTCITCHNPHEATGAKWSNKNTPAEDDALCLTCHEQFKQPAALTAHTHHKTGSAGSHCMDCHMPRINEGLQDIVRTHMIYSPTRADMIESNQPNACGLCHTDQTIDWMLGYLKKWYGAEYSEAALAESYPRRELPAALGWLKGDNPAVRMVAADALMRSADNTALAELLDALDDPYFLNRRFAMAGLERRLNIDFAELGYRFYMTPDERRGPLARIRERVLSGQIESKKAP